MSTKPLSDMSSSSQTVNVPFLEDGSKVTVITRETGNNGHATFCERKVLQEKKGGYSIIGNLKNSTTSFA